MSEVAAEAGVSQGTLYNYVQSKTALFYLLVDRGLSRRLPAPGHLPVPTPPMGAILRRLQEQIARTFALPRLDAALSRRRVVDAGAELHAILSKLYTRTEDTRLGAAAIERSALDLPELAAFFFGTVRADLLERLTRYIQRRMHSAHFRRVPDAAVAARVMLETITWFARHRHQDPEPMDVDPATIRDTVIAMLVGTLIHERHAKRAP